MNSLWKSSFHSRSGYTNNIVPAFVAAVIQQSATVVHDQCSPWWDAGRNLSEQTQHPLPPPLALHHLPSAQTECQSLGGPQGARSKMEEMGHINTPLPFTLGAEIYWRAKGSNYLPLHLCGGIYWLLFCRLQEMIFGWYITCCICEHNTICRPAKQEI